MCEHDAENDGMDLDAFFPPWRVGMAATMPLELPDKWVPRNWGKDEFARRVDMACMQAEAMGAPADPIDVIHAIGRGYITLDSKGRPVPASEDFLMVQEVFATLVQLPTATERNAG
jgi:hypothetical protein